MDTWLVKPAVGLDPRSSARPARQGLRESTLVVEVVARAFAVWLVILVLAVVNGTLRQGVLIPRLGATSGLVLSGLLLASLILAVTYLFLPWLGIRRTGQLLLLGACWLALTLGFEFLFGLLRGKRLPEMLEAYTFKGGNLWPAVLVVTALAPWLGGKLRGWL